jgi:hypothetical protein
VLEIDLRFYYLISGKTMTSSLDQTTGRFVHASELSLQPARVDDNSQLSRVNLGNAQNSLTFASINNETKLAREPVSTTIS